MIAPRENSAGALERILALVQDALADMDVLRRHVASGEEVRALRRVFLALGDAEQEIREQLQALQASPPADVAQGVLPLRS